MNLRLPEGNNSSVDLSRVIREVEALDDFMVQAAIRTPGVSLKLPKSSKLFEELVSINNLNMLRQEDRGQLKEFLTTVQSKAPVLHVSFSADPSPLFMQKLMSYLRREIHPLVLVDTGLQPIIGAGCILRTTNKYFDFSLRQKFLDKRGLLLEKIQADSQSKPQPPGAGVAA